MSKNRTSLTVSLAALLVSVALHGAGPTTSAEERPPNIVFILADDVGQEVLGCYGGTSYPTPNLDALAASGTRFRHAYSMAVCHPTRITFLSGRYPFRLKHPKWGSYPKREEARTIAHALKKAGYATAVAGKWQLALLKNDPEHPRRMGFDDSCLFGWHEGPRYYQPLIWQNGEIRADVTDRYGPEVYCDFLIDFMKRNRERPFFAFYSMALCHDVTDDIEEPVPFGPGKNRYDNYAEMAASMDRMVGRLVGALDRLELRENTLVFFIGDNGTPPQMILEVEDGEKLVRRAIESRVGDRVVKGAKGKLTDGGTRVPCIASWPGTTPAGRVVDDLLDVSDLYPTFLDLARAPPVKSPSLRLDGKSFAGLLRGQGGSPRRWVFAEHGKACWVRDRRWKLYNDGRLHDMDADPEEKKAIAESEASKDVVSARRRLRGALTTLVGDALAPPPNILWIFVEDMNDWMGCYGDTLIQTPHIDALAAAGVRFDRAFMPAGVCSATRSAVITGTMQTTYGLHNHRSSRSAFRGQSMGDDYDAIRLPEGVKTLPELFRQAGYYTFNEGKEDYNFVHDLAKLYDRKGKRMGFQGARKGSEWSGRKPGQPFFGQIQLRGGKSGPQRIVSRAAVTVPPYYPNLPIIRDEIAHHYDCVLQTDRDVGDIVTTLKRDGLYESTVIFFFTDHGMRLLRHKQFLYEGGIKVPLIVAAPGSSRFAPGVVRKDLVSGIDLAPTALALAGLKIPGHMEGQDLFASDYAPRKFIIAARDRCDYTIERIRAVRTAHFKYLRNYLTDRPYMQPQYRDGRPHTELMKRLYAEGKLDPVQARFMASERPAEELYDLRSDPHETKNLAGDLAHTETLEKHRKILADWIAATGDRGQQPESDAGLRAALKRWGEKCVNPEYDRVRQKKPVSPKR